MKRLLTIALIFLMPSIALAQDTTYFGLEHGTVRIYSNTNKYGTGTAYVPLVDSDGHLQVDALTSGTQYTEGDTDSTITGTVAMGEAGSNTVRPFQLDASNNLKVNAHDSTIRQTPWNISEVSSAVVDVPATAGPTEVIALVSGKKVKVMGFGMIAHAAQTARWVYGTGTDCATDKTALTGWMSFAANGGIMASPGSYPHFSGADSNALCLELGDNTSTYDVEGWVTYKQE